MPEMHLLTGAYALDALDDIERAGFERHLRSCASCADEVIELREATTGLAGRVAVNPPDYLRSRVMAQVSRTRQVSPNGPSPSDVVRLRRPSLRRALATAAAAVVIAGAAGLGGVAWQSHQSAQDARVAAARAAELTQVLTDPDRQEASERSSVGGTAAVFAAGGKAVLATDQLPAPPSGKTYQVWVIDKSEKISSAGLLTLKDGRGQSLVTGFSEGDTVALSVEPAGGSKQPTTEPIVAVKVA